MDIRDVLIRKIFSQIRFGRNQHYLENKEQVLYCLASQELSTLYSLTYYLGVELVIYSKEEFELFAIQSLWDVYRTDGQAKDVTQAFFLGNASIPVEAKEVNNLSKVTSIAFNKKGKNIFIKIFDPSIELLEE